MGTGFFPCQRDASVSITPRNEPVQIDGVKTCVLLKCRIIAPVPCVGGSVGVGFRESINGSAESPDLEGRASLRWGRAEMRDGNNEDQGV
jgi:hypothetical protein